MIDNPQIGHDRGPSEALWNGNVGSGAVVAAITSRNEGDDDDVINEDDRADDDEVVGENAGHHVIHRGLFRRFSLKVIEWIRKSLELGRNEVCDECLLS